MGKAGDRLRRLAQVLRSENTITASAKRVLEELLAEAARALAGSGYDTSVLDARFPGWRRAIDRDLQPAILTVFTTAWQDVELGVVDPTPYGTRYLESVHNRLVGVSDDVFDSLRLVLAEGREREESIPELAARVDALLRDDQRWESRARTIARTEVIGANNAGAHGSIAATIRMTGDTPDLVVKEWLSSHDSRVRDTHKHADGQQVVGLDTAFRVGSSRLQFPGDSSGAAEEVINCRCSVVYLLPGDPNYPSDVASIPDGNRTTAPAEVGVQTSATAPTGLPDESWRTSWDTPAAVVSTVARAAKSKPDADPFDPPAPTATALDAREMSVPDLQRQVVTGKPAAKATAKAELNRRGIAASAAPSTDEGTMMTDQTPEAEHSTVVLVALPTQGDPVYDIGPEDKHATILFMGEASTLPEGAREALSAAAAAVAGEWAPFTEDVDAVAPLGDDGAQVWMLDGDTLPLIRDALLGQPDVTPLLDNTDQYPTFQPHVTIGYLTDDPDMAAIVEAAGLVEEISFDRLALWWAGEHTEWDLTGTATDDTADDAVVEIPAEAVTAAAGDPAPVTEAAAGDPAPADGTGGFGPDTPGYDRFYGVMVVEDSQTGDNRVFAPGSLTWDTTPLPFPLGWQVNDAPGHDGSVVCGRIDSLTRMGNLITYTGTWDLNGPGWETRRLVEGRFLTGLSVDTDDFDAEVVSSDGTVADPFMYGPDDDTILRVNGARIRSAAMCRVPAFVEAFVANGLPPAGWAGERPGAPVVEGEVIVEDIVPVDEVVVTAALVAAAVKAGNPPLTLPAFTDFSDPQLTQPTPITITDDGRVYGHLAAWGTCHIGLDGCVEPPASRAAYAYFLTGEVDTDTGTVPVGQITMGTGHAGTQMSAAAAAYHYDDTGFAVADVFAGEDEIGIWVSGRVRPGTTAAQIREIRAAGAISGDWRAIQGNLELVAALAVNVPGFPLPRMGLAASAGRPTALVAAGVIRAPQPARIAPVDTTSLATLVSREVGVVLARRERALSAMVRLDQHATVRRNQRVASVRARLTKGEN